MTRRFATALLLFFALAACNDPTSPEVEIPHGRLTGLVTIGPNCPVEKPGSPCPTPPGAYAERKVLVFDESGKTQRFVVDIDLHGVYLIDLVPGKYTIDLKKTGIDHSADVPVVVEIRAFQTTKLDINIDTGLR